MSATNIIIIVVTILYLHSLRCSASFIHTTLPGIVTYEMTININIMVEDLHGVVLYIVDSERTQFGIEVIEGDHEERFVQIMFNKRYNTVSLHELCGCYHCEARMVRFIIRLSDTDFSVTCNYEFLSSVFSRLFSSTAESSRRMKNRGVRYPLPSSVSNEGNVTFIAIGNIGPMIGEGNLTVAPLAQQIIGCLMDFSYDFNQVKFIEEGSAMRGSCPESCDEALCNGGRCHPRHGPYSLLDRHPICDCSSIALKGLYCSKALRRYHRDGCNTYTIDRRASLKMSWEVSSPWRYCLLEVVRGGEAMTLVIEGGHLTVNSTIISRIDTHDTNYLHIDIRYHYYIFKTKYNESNISAPLGTAFLVNIGFSKWGADCRTLEGSYDLVVDSRHPIKRCPASTLRSIKWYYKIALYIVGLSIPLLMALIGFVTVVRKRMRGRTNRTDENVYEAEVVGMDLRRLQIRLCEDSCINPSNPHSSAA